MKRFLFASLAFCMMFAACQKEDDSPTVSFESALPVTSDGTATLTINVSDYTGTEPLTIPVTFITDAVEGTDYEVSAKEFVYGGTSPVTSITVTTLKYGTDKEITASLVLDKCKAGRYTSTTFPLSEKLGYISFDSKASLMTQTVSVQVNVYDKNGNRKALEKGDKIAVSVDAASTAVEGTNFAFDGEKAVVIDAGASSGNVKLKMVGDDAVKDNDKIVLKLDLGEKYSEGQNVSTTITILGSAFNKLDGKWVINEFITDKDWMAAENWLADMGYDIEEQLGKYPKFNAEDTISFDLGNSTFTPSLASDFKNYFIGESSIKPAGEIIFRDMMTKETIEMFSFDNINRYFNNAPQSEDKTALVGIKIDTDTDGKDLLKMYIIDYEPKDFLSFLYEFSSIDTDIRPTCATGGTDKASGLPVLMREATIRMTFKKAQ